MGVSVQDDGTATLAAPAAAVNDPVDCDSRTPVRRIVLAVNRRAGGGTADREAAEALFQETGCIVHTVEIDASNDHVQHLADSARDTDAIVIAGGDGTINRLLPVLIEQSCPVGLLPMGTANDLARTLSIPTDLTAAARVILEGRIRAIDVGRANGHYFCNALGIGASVDVSREMNVAEKAVLGVVAYARAVWRVLKRSPGFRVAVQGDGIDYHGRAIQVTVANGVHYGGGMTVHESAAIDDGALDVLVVRPRSPLNYLRHFFAFRFGRYGPEAPVWAGRASTITVVTSRSRPCALDGEVRTRTPLDVIVQRAALRVFVPGDSTDE